MDFYQNRKNSESYRSLSANFYRININQPLNFFSSNKWQRKLAKANLTAQKISVSEDYVTIKRNVSKLFFSLLTNNCKLKDYQHEKTVLKKLFDTYKELSNHKRILNIDFKSVELKILELENAILSLEDEHKNLIAQMTLYIGIDVEAASLLLPKPICPFIDESSAINYLKNRQKKHDKSLETVGLQGIAQAKSQKRISASLNIGVGLNASSDEISTLWDKKISNQNISLSITVPITDRKVKNNQYYIAKLDYKRKQENIYLKNNKEELELKNLIHKINSNKLSYDYCLQQLELIKKEKELKYELLNKQRIMFNDYERTLDKYFDVENNIISLIADSYDINFNIEYLTLYDFILFREITF